MRVDTVLFDLDGVIRHFDPDRCHAAATTHGVPAGELREAAFSADNFGLVITGKLTREEWVRNTGDIVGSAAAATEWLTDIGAVDPQAVEVLRQLRTWGFQIALLTNGTDQVETELATHQIDHHFDRVFNTARIGIAKPNSGAFLHVAEALDRDPSRVFFTDDSLPNIDAASSLGFHTHHFTGIPGLRDALEGHGIGRGMSLRGRASK
jgi:HAD superfamily hydrolase (TIGR01509 family)